MLALRLLGLILRGSGLMLALAAAASPAHAVRCQAQVFESKRYTVCELNLRHEALSLYLRDEQAQTFRHFDNLAQWLARRRLRLTWALNAGMYHPDMTPVGWFVSNAMGPVETVTPLNTEPGRGNFFLQPNGVFMISQQRAWVMSTSEAQAWPNKVSLATQSGPLLVRRGQLHPALTPNSPSRLIRNGVGVSAPDRVWFAISDEPVNFHEFAKLFRDALRCPDALYLDGNVSSLYAPPLRRHDKHAVLGPILAVTEPAK